MGVRLHR